MTSKQLLKHLYENRELLHRNHAHAYEHLQTLIKDYAHHTDEEVVLNMELNRNIAEAQFHSEYEKVIQNCLQVIGKFKDSVYKGPIVRHYILLGRCYANTGEFKKAEEALFSALKMISPADADYVSWKVDILHVLTMNEQIAERGPDKSVQYLTEALDLLKDDNSPRKANCLMGLGNVYINADMVDLALENYQAAAVTFEHHFDLSNMGNVYSNIGTCYLKMDDYEQAEKYLEKSLELRMKVGSPEHLSISYYNLALVCKAEKKFDRAEELLLKCKDILLHTDSKPFLQDTEDQLAEVALLKNKQVGVT